MFYLASNSKGPFVFYFEDNCVPYTSSYGNVKFPTITPELRTTYKLDELIGHLLNLGSTIIDTDTSYYKLIERHPEYLI